MNTITQELVRELFDYKDGMLFWKKRTAQCVKIGTRAGHLKLDDLYRLVRVKGKHIYEHKVIFLWHKGYLPKVVDHEDTNRLNNNIENLREATRRQNNCNRSSAKGSSSKYLGVHKIIGRNAFQAAIRVNRKPIHLGNFKSENEAALAYNRGAVKYHGEFANLNIISNG
jgi:hypothetical protein